MVPASAPKKHPPKTVGEAITIPYYRTIGGGNLVGLRGVCEDSPCLKKYCNTRLQQVSPGVQLVVKWANLTALNCKLRQTSCYESPTQTGAHRISSSICWVASNMSLMEEIRRSPPGMEKKNVVNNGISTTNVTSTGESTGFLPWTVWLCILTFRFQKFPNDKSPDHDRSRSLPLTKSSDPRLIIKREPCCKHRSNHESFLIKASANVMQTEEPMTSMIWKGLKKNTAKLMVCLKRKNRVSTFNFLFHGSLAKWVVNDDPFSS